jgi:hypothetical protein
MAPRLAHYFLAWSVAVLFIWMRNVLEITVSRVQSLQFEVTPKMPSEWQAIQGSSTAAEAEEHDVQTIKAGGSRESSSELLSNTTLPEKKEEFTTLSRTVKVEEQEALETGTNMTDPRPRNLRLVFMGDSITRYQYVALAYFLKTGQWLTEGISPHPLHFPQFGGSRNKYFRASNSMLFPEEHCDCIMQVRDNFTFGYSENRYFSDPERGNYVAFISRFGFRPTSGHWQPESAFNETAEKLDVLNYAHPGVIPYEWVFRSWHETITHHIAKLIPKPDFVVFNAGIHLNDMWKPRVHYSLLKATKAAAIIPIYKTTTYSQTAKRGASNQHSSHEKLLCGTAAPYCLDLSWTGDIDGPLYYFDNWHLRTDANTRMNLQLLEYLQMISSGENTTNVFAGVGAT